MHRVVEIIQLYRKQARLREVHTSYFLSYVGCLFYSLTFQVMEVEGGNLGRGRSARRHVAGERNREDNGR